MASQPSKTSSKSRKRRVRASQATSAQPTIHAHAAGIDVGAQQIYVAVPTDSVAPDAPAVRCFDTSQRIYWPWQIGSKPVE